MEHSAWSRAHGAERMAHRAERMAHGAEGRAYECVKGMEHKPYAQLAQEMTWLPGVLTIISGTQ